MRLLAVIVKVGERELRSVCGQLHREAVADAVGALPVHESEALGIPGGKRGGDLWTGDKSKEILTVFRSSFVFKSVKAEKHVCRPYDISVQGRAGALLSDSHAEARQAAIFVGRAEVEGARLAAGA